MEYERAVRLVDGRVVDVLGPGRHSYRSRRAALHRIAEAGVTKLVIMQT